MAVKIGKMLIGESPEEQLKLEKKRFKNRQKRRLDAIEKKREEFKARGDHPDQTKLNI